MENVIEYIGHNKEWIFSGIGVTILLIMSKLLFKQKKVEKPIKNKNITTINNIIDVENKQKTNKNKKKYKSVIDAKNNVNILFIDDDTKFKMINILKNAGWKNTKIVKDINNLHSSDILNSDIFFVDIQGVGKKLSFSDEGLGLANALKREHPQKKVVIYSAENRGDRFHDGLRKADDFLAKNADPYEFEQIIENFFVEG